MSFKVTLVRKGDGVKVELTEGGSWDGGAEFRWTEGNESCDCVRARLFAFARGEEASSPDVPCGHSLFEAVLPAITHDMERSR